MPSVCSRLGKSALRTAARLVVSTMMRLRSRALESQADAIIIAPHADDETFGCGGLIFLKRRAAAGVQIVFLTDGAASHPNHPQLTPTALSLLRRQEAVRAAAALGTSADALTFLDCEDGTLAHQTLEARTRLVACLTDLLARTKATEIYLPLERDGSSEHESAFEIVSEAIRSARRNFRVFQFPVWAWWSPRLLWRASLRKQQIWRLRISKARPSKHKAMDEYRSQLRPVAPWPEPVLPSGFGSAFLGTHEYFFEA
jgi:LmbE family N-acetylglucosaminyl deacetylase